MEPFMLYVEEFLITELLYFLMIASLCLAIFLKTREIYKLTGHRGIGFFRNIFLYFMIGYFFRFSKLAIILSKGVNKGLIHLFNNVNFLFFGYFSTLAVLNIGLAVIAKKIKISDTKIMIITQIIAVLSSIILFLTNYLGFIVLIQMSIFIITFIIGIIGSEENRLVSKLFSNSSMTYGMLFLFWVINTILFNRSLFTLNMRIALYILSLLVFISIFVRVHKRLRLCPKEVGLK